MSAADSQQAAEWRAWLAVLFGRSWRSPAELRRIASRLEDAGNRETALRFLAARHARRAR